MDAESRVCAPVPENERQAALDVLRGVALFGVLWVNLLTEFRLSLFEHLFTFHTHPGIVNEWIDLVTTWLVEYKAFTVFSFLFGVGIGIQTERKTLRGARGSGFLLRRFAILFIIGIVHMFLIWNGDILCLYAICGLLIIPFLRLPTWLLVCLGVAAISFNFTPLFGAFLPSEKMMRVHAASATPIYASGSFTEILDLRRSEAWSFMIPLLTHALPKTFGLMLLGMATWRAGILKRPAAHRRFLAIFFVVATLVGASATSFIFWSAIVGKELPAPVLVDALSYIPLALGLASGLTLWLSYPRTGCFIDLLAAAGRMALTNYLVQSIVFSLIFYGYGLQLFGKLSPAPTAIIGVAVFSFQLVVSITWLRCFHFGPPEWLWRSLTYESWQRMRRTE
ncbi:MAG: DUF418 domain-containing protein [Luteolibacter sp.]|uniref:DUF418 domain-containing protein n=1 Tax=Luteolibacter sp. TaxID=1962973 RepID=UPI0032661A8C